MKLFSIAVVAIAVGCAAGKASAAVDGSKTVYGPLGTFAAIPMTLSTTAQDVMPQAPLLRIRLILQDTDYQTASGGKGIVEWCRYGTAAAAPAAAHGLGSFPLFPGGGIDDSGAGVWQGPVNCIAESGAPLLRAEQY